MSYLVIFFLFVVLIFLFVILMISYRPFKGKGFKPFVKCYYAIGINLIRNRPNFWSIINYIKRYYSEKKVSIILGRNEGQKQIEKNHQMFEVINILSCDNFKLSKINQKKYNFNIIGILNCSQVDAIKVSRMHEPCNYSNFKIECDSFSTKLNKNNFYNYNFLFLNFKDMICLFDIKRFSDFVPYVDYLLVNYGNKTEDYSIKNSLNLSGFLKLSRQNGYAFYVKERVVLTNTIGLNGEFGNQIMQYLTVRVLSIRNNRRLQSSSWVGQQIFNDSVAIPEKKKQRNIREDENKFLVNKPEKIIDKQYVGAFNFQTKYLATEKKFLKSTFSFRSKYLDKFDDKIDALKSGGKTIIGLQLRISGIDTDLGTFKPLPIVVYKNWLENNWSRYDNPVLFIASDVIEEAVKYFEAYNPVTAKSLGLKDSILYLPDYYVLTKVDILVTSFSTFSFTAAMLNDNCYEFYRPNEDKNCLVPFDPWDSYPHPLTVIK